MMLFLHVVYGLIIGWLNAAWLTDDELSGKQRSHLKGLAHDLDPSVLVGQAGVTDAVVDQVEAALAAHELIKIRLAGHRDARQAMAEEVARRLDAHLVDSIGRMAILYRAHPDPEERRISLP